MGIPFYYHKHFMSVIWIVVPLDFSNVYVNFIMLISISFSLFCFTIFPFIPVFWFVCNVIFKLLLHWIILMFPIILQNTHQKFSSYFGLYFLWKLVILWIFLCYVFSSILFFFLFLSPPFPSPLFSKFILFLLHLLGLFLCLIYIIVISYPVSYLWLNWEDTSTRIYLVPLNLSETNFFTYVTFLQPKPKLSWRPKVLLVWWILLVWPVSHIYKTKDKIS